MVAIWVLIFFLIFLIYTLFTTIDLFIDTTSNKYYIQLKGLIKVSIEASKKEIIKAKLRLLFMNFYFFPLKVLSEPKKKKSTDRNQSTSMPSTIKIQKGMQLLKSFKVKKFNLEIDSGDCILNAKLYPLFSFLNFYIGNFKVNFQGKNRLILHLQSRPIYILKSFIIVKK